jgi:tripartite-type tricarboxylate transporter receptor subunit TctC
VKIIVGQAAGSSSDIVARLVAQFLSDKLGQQFLVEVRPGAAGNIATEAVPRLPPDGYTLLLVNSQNAINVALYEKLSFDFVMAGASFASAFGRRCRRIIEFLRASRDHTGSATATIC